MKVYTAKTKWAGKIWVWDTTLNGLKDDKDKLTLKFEDLSRTFTKAEIVALKNEGKLTRKIQEASANAPFKRIGNQYGFPLSLLS